MVSPGGFGAASPIARDDGEWDDTYMIAGDEAKAATPGTRKKSVRWEGAAK